MRRMETMPMILPRRPRTNRWRYLPRYILPKASMMWVSSRTARIGAVMTFFIAVLRAWTSLLTTRFKTSFSVKIPTGTSSSVTIMRPTSSATIFSMTSKTDAVTAAVMRWVVMISLTLLESIGHLHGFAQTFAGAEKYRSDKARLL